VLDPEPVVVVPPGLLVNVQLPLEGKPFRTTLPVERRHVGCVIVPTTGGVGVDGCAFITTVPDAVEVHPAALDTV
jgi:hypothetical protein